MTTSIVHAGVHKTGTKTLQRFLARHRGWLAAKGVDFPADPGGHYDGQQRLAAALARSRRNGGPNDLFTPIREQFATLTQARSLTADALEQALRTDQPVRLLSSEMISTFDAGELVALKALTRIDRVVVYVRDGIEYVHSCWSALVRWGHTGSFSEFLQRTLQLDPSTPLIGPPRFAAMVHDILGVPPVVRSFSAALKHPRGLTGDFLEEEMKLGDTRALGPAEICNVSDPPFITEALRAANIRTRDGGEIPQVVHERIRAATIGADGAQLRDALLARITRVLQRITIGDLRPQSVAADGSLRLPVGDVVRPLFDAWRFPQDEAVMYADTADLMECLATCEGFEQAIRRP
jgi:hypothetical protein